MNRYRGWEFESVDGHCLEDALFTAFEDPHDGIIEFGRPGGFLPEVGASCSADETAYCCLEGLDPYGGPSHVGGFRFDEREANVIEKAFPHLWAGRDTVFALIQATWLPEGERPAAGFAALEDPESTVEDVMAHARAIGKWMHSSVMTQDAKNLVETLIRKDLSETPEGWEAFAPYLDAVQRKAS